MLVNERLSKKTYEQLTYKSCNKRLSIKSYEQSKSCNTNKILSFINSLHIKAVTQIKDYLLSLINSLY